MAWVIGSSMMLGVCFSFVSVRIYFVSKKMKNITMKIHVITTFETKMSYF